MNNTCDTQYKVRGTRKAMTDLWNTLQAMNVNTTGVYLCKLAEHYGIDYGATRCGTGQSSHGLAEHYGIDYGGSQAKAYPSVIVYCYFYIVAFIAAENGLHWT